MKKMYCLGVCATLFAMVNFQQIKAQSVSNFDNLTLGTDTFWNGSTQTGGFSSGDAYFPNYWDTAFGGYWASGWVYSNKADTVNSFPNIFSASTGIDYSGSGNYALGQHGSVIQLTGNALGNTVSGVYVTNSTYAYISMRDGDQIAKKFGGVSGNDQDWFRLTIKGYAGGNLTTDSVDFYLADYRFTDNDSDYIVTSWEWVDLTSLGNIDSIIFTLNSTDNGQFGMNTPSFFCIDNVNGIPARVNELSRFEDFDFYPNPANSRISLSFLAEGEFEIYDVTGKLIEKRQISRPGQLIYDVEHLNNGIYLLKYESKGLTITKKLIKNT